MHDPDARPIAKGRLGKPVEFGYYAASRVMPRRDAKPFSRSGSFSFVSA